MPSLSAGPADDGHPQDGHAPALVPRDRHCQRQQPLGLLDVEDR
jgi:hypothetical protein